LEICFLANFLDHLFIDRWLSILNYINRILFLNEIRKLYRVYSLETFYELFTFWFCQYVFNKLFNFLNTFWPIETYFLNQYSKIIIFHNPVCELVIIRSHKCWSQRFIV
jgi:hypothetical protein